MKYPDSYARKSPDNDPENSPRNDQEQNRRMAVSLEGEDLDTWNVHVTDLRERESLLSAAIKTNDIFVAIATPFAHLFKALGVPLRLLTYSTSGMIHILFRLLLTPFFGVVLATSSIWATKPAARPLLIIIGPPFVMLTLWLLPLFPEQSEIREAKISLCKVWPLSRRRLEWIKTHRVY
jgi:hypothetical protein